MTNNIPRYLYVKNGDVVRQLKTIEALSGKVPDGGPNAFLASFLDMIGCAPLLLLSAKSTNSRIVIRNVRARVFRSKIHALGALGRPVALVQMFFVSLVEALRHRPRRVICGTTGVLLWMSYLVARGHSSLFIHSRHNRVEQNASSLKKKLTLALDCLVMKQANGIICHGPYLRDQLVGLGVKKEIIVEFDSGLRDLIADATGQRESLTDVSGNAHTIAYLGRIEVDKGVFDLLEACGPRLREDRLVRLAYAGEGKALHDLKKWAAKLGIADRVIFLGDISHRQVGKLLRDARLLVTPTRKAFPEGRCMAAMEGLAFGVPVVAPNFGPFPYLIKDSENGLLYEPDSVHDLRAKISALLDDETLYKRLARGAKTSGKRLLDPPVRFGEAVQRACAASRPPHHHPL